MGSGNLEMSLPPVSSYLISITIGALPKFFLILIASAVAALRADLFSSALNESGRRDLPWEICFYSEDDGDYRGDRICNNALANAIVCILVAISLMMVELLIPCLNSTYAKLAHKISSLWEGLMAVYWIITTGLLGDLYKQYCSDNECDIRERKFLALPILAGISIVVWILVSMLSAARTFLKK